MYLFFIFHSVSYCLFSHHAIVLHIVFWSLVNSGGAEKSSTNIMNKVKVSTGDEKNKNQKKRDSIRHEIRKKRLELAIIKIIMGPTPRQPSLKHIVTLVTFFLLLIILSQAVCLILYIYFCFLINLFLGVIFGPYPALCLVFFFFTLCVGRLLLCILFWGLSFHWLLHLQKYLFGF